MELQALKSLSDASGMDHCRTLWVIWESETSSQDPGSAVCSLYLDTAGSHGLQTRGTGRERNMILK